MIGSCCHRSKGFTTTWVTYTRAEFQLLREVGQRIYTIQDTYNDPVSIYINTDGWLMIRLTFFHQSFYAPDERNDLRPMSSKCHYHAGIYVACFHIWVGWYDSKNVSRYYPSLEYEWPLTLNSKSHCSHTSHGQKLLAFILWCSGMTTETFPAISNHRFLPLNRNDLWPWPQKVTVHSLRTVRSCWHSYFGAMGWLQRRSQLFSAIALFPWINLIFDLGDRSLSLVTHRRFLLAVTEQC